MKRLEPTYEGLKLLYIVVGFHIRYTKFGAYL